MVHGACDRNSSGVSALLARTCVGCEIFARPIVAWLCGCWSRCRGTWHGTWRYGTNTRALCWDVTVISPLAKSYVNGAARKAGAAAELTASGKEEKYADIEGRYVFEPNAIETLGVLSLSVRQLMSLLGRRFAQVSGERTLLLTSSDL